MYESVMFEQTKQRMTRYKIGQLYAFPTGIVTKGQDKSEQ